MKLTKAQKQLVQKSQKEMEELEQKQENIYQDCLKKLNIENKEDFWLFDYLYNGSDIKTLENL